MEDLITFDKVVTIVTLLFSAVSIAIAIYSSRQTSKDATRQIDSIKELSKLQLDITIKQLEFELNKCKTAAKHSEEASEDLHFINSSPWVLPHSNRENTQFQEKQMRREENQQYGNVKYYQKMLDDLHKMRKRLTKKEL